MNQIFLDWLYGLIYISSVDGQYCCINTNKIEFLTYFFNSDFMDGSFLNMSFDIGTLMLTLIRGGFYHE